METKILKAEYQGEIDFVGFKISCAVLEDGTRVLVNRSVANAFELRGSGAYWQKKKEQKGAALPEYLSVRYLQPFINESLRLKLSESIPYINNQGILTEGLRAEYLADICDIFKQAGEKGALKNPDIGNRAYKIILALSKVAIIALIDEATGYQYDREKNALQAILKLIVSDEILAYQQQFQLSFYKEIYRLWNIPFTEKYIKRKPQFIGILTNKYVYSNMPAGTIVLEKLKEKTPKSEKGNYKYRFHQSLTENEGRETLKKVLYTVEALASISRDKEHFKYLINEKYGQKELPFPDYNKETDIDKLAANENAESKDESLSIFNQSLKQTLKQAP